jgi:hypothetical protein
MYVDEYYMNHAPVNLLDSFELTCGTLEEKLLGCST